LKRVITCKVILVSAVYQAAMKTSFGVPIISGFFKIVHSFD